MPYNRRIFGLHTNENYFHEVIFYNMLVCVGAFYFRLLILFCNTVLLKHT